MPFESCGFHALDYLQLLHQSLCWPLLYYNILQTWVRVKELAMQFPKFPKKKKKKDSLSENCSYAAVKITMTTKLWSINKAIWLFPYTLQQWHQLYRNNITAKSVTITAKSVTITRNLTVLDQQWIQHNRVGKPG